MDSEWEVHRVAQVKLPLPEEALASVFLEGIENDGSHRA